METVEVVFKFDIDRCSSCGAWRCKSCNTSDTSMEIEVTARVINRTLEVIPVTFQCGEWSSSARDLFSAMYPVELEVLEAYAQRAYRAQLERHRPTRSMCCVKA
jgi:hypothetical protein